MRERTETGFEAFPEGKNYEFIVTEPAEKRKTPKGKYYYIFRFKTLVDGRPRKYTEAVMTWMAGDLLKALGCEEVQKGVFDWDKAEIVNRQVVADIVHEPDKNDPTTVRAKMRNIRPPLQEPIGLPTTAMDSTDEPPVPEEDQIPF